MKNIPYWLDIPYEPRPSLSQDIKADVVVIGGGITGVSTAYHCAKQGLKTVLIEKDTIASGSAGRNGGMVVEGLEIDFSEAVEKFGLETAKDLWSDTAKAREHVAQVIHSEHIDCDLEKAGSLYAGFSEKDKETLIHEVEIRKQHGIKGEIIEKGKQLHGSPIGEALFNSEDYLLHPAKFIRGLAKASEKYGATIYENTEALHWDSRSVKTSQGNIVAEKVVIALESYNPSLNSEESEVISSQAIVTEPLPSEQIAKLDWKYGKMLWPTGFDYISVRLINDRLFSCKTSAVSASEEEEQENREWQINRIHELFPVLDRECLEISHFWTGLMVCQKEYHPIMRMEEGCYKILGHGGNGLTFGIWSGKLLAESFVGRLIPEIYRG